MMLGLVLLRAELGADQQITNFNSERLSLLRQTRDGPQLSGRANARHS